MCMRQSNLDIYYGVYPLIDIRLFTSIRGIVSTSLDGISSLLRTLSKSLLFILRSSAG
jgi:hypothetical protein